MHYVTGDPKIFCVPGNENDTLIDELRHENKSAFFLLEPVTTWLFQTYCVAPFQIKQGFSRRDNLWKDILFLFNLHNDVSKT